MVSKKYNFDIYDDFGFGDLFTGVVKCDIMKDICDFMYHCLCTFNILMEPFNFDLS